MVGNEKNVLQFAKQQLKDRHLIVIGGGAAGIFCAVNAARLHPNLRVTVLEKTSKLLSKVKVSGGGRCNVTHALFDITEISQRYPRGQHFVKKSFHQFFTSDTIRWFEQRGVKLKAEKDGRMFPVTDSSQTIIDCLLNEANLFGADIRMMADVREMLPHNDGFTVHLANGDELTANYIVVACGGYPKSCMFDWLRKLGHLISEPVPSLFTFNLPGGNSLQAKHPITELMGMSVENARVKIEGSRLVEEGPVLITHWGLSGPAILRLSAWGARELAAKNYEFKTHVNWVPSHNEQSLKEQFKTLRISNASKKVVNHNFTQLPNRLWQFLLETSGVIADCRFADLPAKTENALIKNLVDYAVEVKGKTTFKEEFVTAGGIHLSEVDANTMMSKKVPNLFFAGEILDVDGITGGFNFQHAWTSSWIAANSIARNS
jgi:predicted Rossmann fold flavoprotein